jgi:hypothetical protein
MPSYPILKSRKIKYNSPSGFVNIGKYVPPFDEIKNGFGYMGVILEDYKTGKLQCHICGGWYEQMARHIEIHKINSQEYRRRFGLLISTALKSKRMRIAQSKIMQKLRGKNKANRFKFAKNNLFAGNRKGKSKALESQNRYGVCNLQLIERILKLKKKLNKTPTLTELKDEYGFVFITLLYERYGSYVKLCNNLELTPNISNFNPKYSKEYFLQKALDDEPSLRIFTLNEKRAFYKYFNSVSQLKKEVLKIESRSKK